MRVCEIEGCGNPHRAMGLCSTHYSQVWYAERGQRVDEVTSAESNDEDSMPGWAWFLLGYLGGAVSLGALFIWYRDRRSPAA